MFTFYIHLWPVSWFLVIMVSDNVEVACVCKPHAVKWKWVASYTPRIRCWYPLDRRTELSREPLWTLVGKSGEETYCCHCWEWNSSSPSHSHFTAPAVCPAAATTTTTTTAAVAKKITLTKQEMDARFWLENSVERDLEGSGHSVIEGLSLHWPAGNGEKPRKP
jgi:hypothetical protein